MQPEPDRDGPTTVWPSVPVFFATSEGQTARVAERLAQELVARGTESRAVELRPGPTVRGDWSRVRGAIVCASVHYSGHQWRARRFVRGVAAELASVPTLFVSVCLAIHSSRERERQTAWRIARRFGEKAGWRPDDVACIAGRLAYTRYNWLTRWLMRRIAKAEGAATDTTRDHEYTDWGEVAALVETFADRLPSAPAE